MSGISKCHQIISLFSPLFLLGYLLQQVFKNGFSELTSFARVLLKIFSLVVRVCLQNVIILSTAKHKGSRLVTEGGVVN